jgi:hypothetical protein
MTLREVFKDTKKKKKAKNTLDGKVHNKNEQPGVDFNHSGVDTYFDMRDLQ